MSTPESTTDRLHELHQEYVWQVNQAVASNREDLLAGLSADYTDSALVLMVPAN